MVEPNDVPDPESSEEESRSGNETPYPAETQADDPRRAAEEPTRLYNSTPQFLWGPANGIAPDGQLGKYTIQEQLGRGGMGVVWKAFDPDLHRAVAIKVLGDQLLHSPTARRRFLREARAAAAISHPNVLTIHSVEEQERIPFLVMEYVSGKSLREYVSGKGALEPVEVIRLGGQIALGLAAAHAQGVIHRDVKPGNVMLDEGATCAQLTDFGLARVAFDNVELTSHDQNVGTPAYMSPESLRGKQIDARSDLFSLGCVLYLMLTGHSPFTGRSQGEIIHKIIESQPTRLHVLNPAIPEVLSEIVEQLLQKSPDDRFQSAGEVADVLSRLLHQLNQAATDEIPTILAKALPTPEPETSSSPAWWWPLAAVGLLGLLAAVMFNRPPTANAPSGGEEVAADESGDSTDAEGEDSVPVEKFDRLVVGTGPDADYETIAEAVLHANPGATITVVGPGPFADAVVIEGSELDGVRLVASPKAVWKSPELGNRADSQDLGLLQRVGFRI